MTNDSDIVARSSSKNTTISNLFLNIGYDCTFRNRAKGKDVANSQCRMFPCIDKLSSVHPFISNERLRVSPEPVGIAEDHFCKGGASARVVNYVFNNAPNVSMSFRIIQSSKLSRRFVETSMGRCQGLLDSLRGFCSFSCGELTENGATTLPLITNHTTHGVYFACQYWKAQFIQMED